MVVERKRQVCQGKSYLITKIGGKKIIHIIIEIFWNKFVEKKKEIFKYKEKKKKIERDKCEAIKSLSLSKGFL